MQVKVSGLREGDGTGRAIFRWLAANPSGVYAVMDPIAQAKAQEVSADISASAHSHTFTRAAVAERKPFPSGTPAEIIHPTSRGAFAVAAKHGLMRW